MGEDSFRTPKCTDRCEWPVHHGHGLHIDAPGLTMGADPRQVRRVNTTEELHAALAEPGPLWIEIGPDVGFVGTLAIPSDTTLTWGPQSGGLRLGNITEVPLPRLADRAVTGVTNPRS